MYDSHVGTRTPYVSLLISYAETTPWSENSVSAAQSVSHKSRIDATEILDFPGVVIDKFRSLIRALTSNLSDAMVNRVDK